MYLRRNKVRCGESRRTYLSIAHNVWWSGDGAKKAQSRPIVIASFGVEDNVDVDLAREVVVAVENSAPKFPSRRGEGKSSTVRVAQEVRKIEPFLKVLVSKKLRLAEHLPPGVQRSELLEALIRDKLAEPESPVALREEDVLHTVKARLA